MQIIGLLIIAGLALFLPESKKEANNSQTNEEDLNNDELRQTSSHHRASHGRDLPSPPDSSNRDRSLSEIITELPSPDSVETVGKETNEEEPNHASRQTTTHTDHDSVQQRQSRTEKPEPGDAVPTPETSTEMSTDSISSE